MIFFSSGDEDRNRSRDEQYQHQHQHKSHSRKNVIEVIDSPEDYADLDTNDKYKMIKYKTDKPPEDPETIKRRAKFLDADREMTKRKELAREELEARRILRREKKTESPRSHKRGSHQKLHRQRPSSEDPSVIQLSESEDDDDDDDEVDDEDKRYNIQTHLFECIHLNFYVNSSQSEKDDDDEDDDDDTDTNSGTNTKSNYSRSDEQSDVPTSPLSIGDLTKSEHRRRHSRSRSKSNSKGRSSSRSQSRSRSRSRSASRSTRSHSRSTSRDSQSE